MSNGIEMPYEDYMRLIQPIVLCQMKGEEIPYRVEEVCNSAWPLYSNTKNVLLKMLAFYNYDLLSEEIQEEKYGRLIRNLNKLK